MTDYISTMPLLVFDKIFENFSIKELAKIQEVSSTFYDVIDYLKREKCDFVGFISDRFSVTYDKNVIQADKDIWVTTFHGWNQLKWYKPKELACGYSNILKSKDISRRFLENITKFSYESVMKTDYLELCATLPMLPKIDTLNIDSYQYTEDEFGQIMESIRIGKTKKFELQVSIAMPLTAGMVDTFLTTTRSLKVRNITLTNWGWAKLDVESYEGIFHFFESTNLRERNDEDQTCSGTIQIEKLEYEEAIEIMKVLQEKHPNSTTTNNESEISFTKFDELYGNRRICFVKCKNTPLVENLNL